jgi:predicted secreted protein
MKWTSIAAIWALFWVLSAFLVMPFGVKTHDEVGEEKVPGQSLSAPANFNPRRLLVRASVLSTALFWLYYANYVNRWITIKDLDIGPLLGL